MLNPRMLLCVSLLTGASIAAPAAAKTVAKAPKDGAGCLEVVPGKGLGPFRVEMGPSEVKKAGLPISDGALKSWQNAGPYELQVLGAGRSVSGVRLNLKKGEVRCLSAAGREDLRDGLDTPEAIAAWIGECGPLQVKTGASTISCADQVMVLQSLGGLDVHVGPDVSPPASEGPICAGYVAPGQGAYLPKQGKVDHIDLEPGKTYCAGGRTLDTSIVEADVLGKLRFNTCKTERLRGGTHVTCPYQGVKLSFAGPKGALHRVAAVPMKD